MKMGCGPQDSSTQSRGGDTRFALTWQLLAKPVPGSDARGRGQWAGSGFDTGTLTVQERERLREGEAEGERQRECQR